MKHSATKCSDCPWHTENYCDYDNDPAYAPCAPKEEEVGMTSIELAKMID